jgi:hypothetical protein
VNTWFDRDLVSVGYQRDENLGSPFLEAFARRCLNADCMKLELSVELVFGWNSATGFEEKKSVNKWRLMPQSSSKPQPSYIPKPLANDYYEACLIRDQSPKASATLSRRCLQGMIRNFAGIARDTLFNEIKALREAVDAGTAPQGVLHESIDAIDHVRTIGNIGAHMEKDINVIIDVDPGEAEALIGLVELLFEEWYVAREQRKERLAKVAGIAADKKKIKGEKPKALPVPDKET